MIRQQAIEQHTAETGHTEFAPELPGPIGTVACHQCPWQYPPAMITPRDDAIRGGTIDPTEIDDPGPAPDDAPEVPVLTLRDRIANVVDKHFVGKFDNDGYDDSEENQRDLVDALHASVGAGADWAPRTEGTVMTPAQALAYLLDLPEWSRLSRLGQLLTEAERAHDCFVYDHAGKLAEIKALHIRAQRCRTALDRIARLCTEADGRETDLQNMIGRIAGEALVGKG